jgi:hypothetical protein
MSFLAPAFLFAGLAIALPVVFHLIRRSTRERKVFSSLMFLLPSPPRLSRRSRLEHLLLLLLRCIAVVLLATGFARPFLKHAFPVASNAAPVKRTLVLVDTSASMRRQGLWEKARDKAEALLAKASPLDQLALFTFDRQFKPLVTFEQWGATPPGDRLGLVRSRLASTQPGWASTHLDSALIQAAELFGETDKDTPALQKQVVVITDLQEGSQTRALQGHEWPKGVQILVERVQPASPNNAGIQLVAGSADADYLSESAVRVRVTNASDSKREQFQAGWLGTNGTFIGKPIDLYVPAGQSRVVSIPAPSGNTPADRIVLRGDDEPFDNTVFVLPPQKSQTTILYVGNDSATESRQPLFFLQRAFQPTRSQTIQVTAQRTSTPLTSAAIGAAGLVIVTDLLEGENAATLREAVSRGSTLLFAPASAAAFAGLGKILGLNELRAEERRLEGYALMGEIDFRHPLFAPFADARYSDFTKIHFWKYRRLEEGALAGAEVLARFDNGDPAILQVVLGKGRIIVLASCWHPADSQLALSSKFVPLLYSLLDLGGAAVSPPRQYFVGDTVKLITTGAGETASTATVALPDGTQVRLKPGETNFMQTLMPGIYSVPSASPPGRFAVNLDAAESRTAPLPADELDRLGVPAPQPVPVASTPADRAARLQSAELEAHQKLWRWFIVAALAVLGLETWLAGRTARRSAVPEELTA